MKRITLLVLAVTSAIYISGCVQIQTGTGPSTSQVREVPSFTSIDYRIPGTLYIDQGAQQTVRVDAGETAISNIRTEVVNSVLVIDATSPFSTTQAINVYVSTNNVSNISSITNSGAGRVSSNTALTAHTLRLTLSGAGGLEAPVNVTQLDIQISGAGSMRLSGNATNMDATISGVGSLNAYGLLTNDTSMTLSGVGSAEIAVQQTLKANVSGVGSVNYHGSPQVTENRTGVGTIKKTG